MSETRDPRSRYLTQRGPRNRRRLPQLAQSRSPHTKLKVDVASLGRCTQTFQKNVYVCWQRPCGFKGNPSRSTFLVFANGRTLPRLLSWATAAASVARLPRGLLTGYVLEQVAQGQAVLVPVEAPRRAGSAPSTAQGVVAHDWPGLAFPGEARDLEPGGPTPLFTFRRVKLGVGDPGGQDMLSEPELVAVNT